MPTREETSAKIDRDLAERGMTKEDPRYGFVRQTMEDMNHGMADLDDELEALAERIHWLLNAPTWLGERPSGQFEHFVEEKLDACERDLAALRQRWKSSLEKRTSSSSSANGET